VTVIETSEDSVDMADGVWFEGGFASASWEEVCEVGAGGGLDEDCEVGAGGGLDEDCDVDVLGGAVE